MHCTLYNRRRSVTGALEKEQRSNCVSHELGSRELRVKNQALAGSL